MDLTVRHHADSGQHRHTLTAPESLDGIHSTRRSCVPGVRLHAWIDLLVLDLDMWAGMKLDSVPKAFKDANLAKKNASINQDQSQMTDQQ